jgi:hypothetical protein
VGNTRGILARNFRREAGFLRILICLAAFACGSSQRAWGLPATTHARHTRSHFRNDMAATVRADHPAMQPVVAAIRAITSNPLEQIVVVNDVTHLLVDYDDDERVYGTEEFHATLDEMLARRREAGWLYLRDDCDGRAVFAAHLLAALGIEWRFEASFWKEHAWIVARVNGVDYDLLDLRRNAPEINRISYKLVGRHFVHASRIPPTFYWRRAWAARTDRNLDIGLRLGLLALDSTPGNLHQRNSTDWTTKAPGKLSPVDDRALTAAVAGFPLGEPLHLAAMAGATAAPRPATGSAIGVSTGSAASAP